MRRVNCGPLKFPNHCVLGWPICKSWSEPVESVEQNPQAVDAHLVVEKLGKVFPGSGDTVEVLLLR